eukprot:1311417-Pleurochrysis_carterae.AAC.2
MAFLAVGNQQVKLIEIVSSRPLTHSAGTRFCCPDEYAVLHALYWRGAMQQVGEGLCSRLAHQTAPSHQSAYAQIDQVPASTSTTVRLPVKAPCQTQRSRSSPAQAFQGT